MARHHPHQAHRRPSDLIVGIVLTWAWLTARSARLHPGSFAAVRRRAVTAPARAEAKSLLPGAGGRAARRIRRPGAGRRLAGVRCRPVAGVRGPAGACGPRRAPRAGRTGRAARDAGAFWDASPSKSLAPGPRP